MRIYLEQFFPGRNLIGYPSVVDNKKNKEFNFPDVYNHAIFRDPLIDRSTLWDIIQQSILVGLNKVVVTERAPLISRFVLRDLPAN